MKITLKGKYKSLNSFESESLNDFTVITGKNGSGKSQLVQLISLYSRNKLSNTIYKLSFNENINNIQIEGLEQKLAAQLRNAENWKNIIDPFFNDYSSLGPKTLELCNYLNKTEILNTEYITSDIFEQINILIKGDSTSLIYEADKERNPTKNYGLKDAKVVLNEFIESKYLARKKTISTSLYVSKFRRKDFTQLEKHDFLLTPLPKELIDNTDLFSSQIENVFYSYGKRRDLNNRLYFDKKEYGDENSSISDIDFISKFPPPWEIINNILSKNKIQFKFKGIDRKDFSNETDIKVELLKKTSQTNIEFQDLSSGEKVIIGLVIKLFASEFYEKSLKFPDLIVLDEPDAHLHPEMSKLLIDVLHKTFVEELGIKIIITSHSPSTIALCPDDSIYQLNNNPSTYLKSIEKEKALKLLTGNIPTLSIDYMNHKQVFVESPTDVLYYQTIFNKLNQSKCYPNRLYFISNSLGKGNCEQVKKTVENIRESGNKTSFGIIDWDLKNQESNYVKVHGLNKRYSIENYLYDPIYLAILLMNLKAHNIYEELNIDETVNQYSLGNESNEYLQAISNWFFTKYYNLYNIDQKKKEELKEIEYLNGKKIKVPKWYLEFSGHDFEKRIKAMFSAIEGKYRSEGNLQKEISLIIGKCFPFIPKDSELLIEEIIKCS